ncbi:glycerophosphodiester phosphodiesterase, partial [Brucella sp. NBRC 113783]
RLAGREGRISDLTLSEATALNVGGTAERVPTLRQMLDLVDGRVPLVIELKGIEGRDDGLVAAVARELGEYKGEAAIMSFDHHLIRRFASDAPGIPGGLTAEGTRTQDFEAHFSMLAHGISFVSYNVHHLPNPFVTFVREKLHMPVISWTVRDREMQKHSELNVEQITFEGFDPRSLVA